MSDAIELMPVTAVGAVRPGDDVGAMIISALRGQHLALQDGDILAVPSKVLAKAEGRIVALRDVVPGARARQFADDWEKDARLIEIVLSESKRIVRMDRGVIVSETRHGFVCANAGVDLSNVDGGLSAVLLPLDPDGSARRLRAAMESACEVRLAVVITDSFGRPWREGQVDVAVGSAGMEPIASPRGGVDLHGLVLRSTRPALIDAAAAAAGLTFGKASGVAACVIRHLHYEARDGAGAGDLVRPASHDLFR